MIVKVKKEVTNPNIDQYCNLLYHHEDTCFVQSRGDPEQYWIVHVTDIKAIQFEGLEFIVTQPLIRKPT